MVYLNGKVFGFGFNVGLYFKVMEKILFGFIYCLQVNMKVKDGDVIFNVLFLLVSFFLNIMFIFLFLFFLVMIFGVGFKLIEKLLFVLDINYIGWKVYDILVFDYVNNIIVLQDIKFVCEYKNSMVFCFGVQYEVVDNLMV